MRLAVVAVLALLAGAAPAGATTFCVAASQPGCVERPTVAAALEAAAGEPGPDTIRIGRHSENGEFDDDGGPVRIVGAGRGVTVLGGIDLGEDGSGVAGVTVRAGLALRGDGSEVEVGGDVRLRDGANLRSSTVAGTITTAGAVTMHSVLAGGVVVESGALTARHLTARTVNGRAAIHDSIVTGAVSGAVAATRSLLPGTDAGLQPNLVPEPSSPAVDADPEPLAATEPETDAAGAVRITDGNGDGLAVRDIGALERPPPAPPSTSGNRTPTPGAARGPAAPAARAAPPPPQWTRTGAFTSVRYGTVSGVFAFPTLNAAGVLQAGRAFFAAGPGGAASLRQVVDVSRWAPEIDARSGAALRLSALLGGFRASDDHAVVTAHFRSALGARLGAITLGTVKAAERGLTTMLSARVARAVIPRLTRSVVVTVRAGTPGGSYNDAYVDQIALVPQIATLHGLPAPRAHARRPFAGAAVLSPRVRVNRRRLARVRVGCPSSAPGGCRGVVTLARSHSVILGARRVSLRPGQIRRLRIPLSRRELRALALRNPGHVFVAVRDAQGLTRSVTARVRILRR